MKPMSSMVGPKASQTKSAISSGGVRATSSGEMQKRQAVFAVVAFLALAAAPACQHRPTLDDPVVPSRNAVGFEPAPDYPDIVWTSSLEEARAQAAEEHKPMILFVRAAWSKASVVMDSTVWHDPRVLAEAQRFVALRVDLTSEYDQQVPAAYKDFDIRGVPTTILVSSKGQILGRFGMGQGNAKDIAASMRVTQ
jgi:thiol:disulfide interchange protein